MLRHEQNLGEELSKTSKKNDWANPHKAAFERLEADRGGVKGYRKEVLTEGTEAETPCVNAGAGSLWTTMVLSTRLRSGVQLN